MIYSYDKFLIELGRKLRQMRIDRGFTLRAMIVKHGFHLAQWQGFEKGKGISVPSLLRMCEVFDLRLEDLIAGVGIADNAKDASVTNALAAEPACEPAKEPSNWVEAPLGSVAKSASSLVSPVQRSRRPKL